MELFDPTNPFSGTYMASLFWGGTGLSPEYTTSTPPNFDATAPLTTSVLFSGYAGSYPGFSSVELPVTGGDYLVLGYDPAVGVDASLSSNIPEPGTLVLLGAGLLALGSLRRRRTR